MRIHELSRLLAGLQPCGAEHPHALDACWREYARDMDLLFDQFNARHARPFERWAENHMGALRSAPAIFYPFSGPDFIFADILCPRAGTYLLCGLESCEMPPEWEALSSEEAGAALRELISGVTHFLRHTYFITKEMRRDFHATPLRGVVPVLLAFLTRAGHIVNSLEPVALDRLGNPFVPGEEAATGVRITFRTHGAEKQLFYFKQDLRDEYCHQEHPLFRFAGRLKDPTVFVKSASYLLHEAHFSHLREWIFDRCASLVQDPSSIPYRSFAQRGWHVRLHGRYVRTLPVFERYEQRDLSEIYETGAATIPRLDFGIGYLTDPDASSLMIATPSTGAGAAAAGAGSQ